MIDLRALYLSDPWTFCAFTIVGTCGVVSVIAQFVIGRLAVRSIAKFTPGLPEMIAQARSGAELSDSDGLLLAPFIDAIVAEAPRRSNERARRYVVRDQPGLAWLDRCDELLRASAWRRFVTGLGTALPGIALFFTFALIATVLRKQIPRAIIDASAVNGSSTELQNAVSLMGTKFWISAIGIGGSLGHRLFLASARGSVAKEARKTLQSLRGMFVPLDEFQLTQSRVLTDRFDVFAMQSQIQGSELITRLERLSSIEVSVKGLGHEVASHLGSLMKSNIGDQIRDSIDVLKVYADSVFTQFQENMVTAFGSTVTRELETVRTALEAIRATIARQSQSDVEHLINQMQDMLSGGFQSQSAEMSKAMVGFRDLLPELGRQMQGLTTSSERTQAMLDHSLAAFGSASQRASEEMQSRLEQSSTAVLKRLMDVSNEALLGVHAQVGEIQATASNGVSHFAREVQAAQTALAGAREGLEKSQRHVEAMAAKLSVTLSETNRAISNAGSTAEQFGRTGTLFAGASGKLEESLAQLERVLDTQRRMIGEQDQLADRLLREVPAQFERSEVNFERQTKLLAQSWETLAQQVKQTIEHTGEQFVDGVDELGAHVQTLNQSLTAGLRTSGVGRTA